METIRRPRNFPSSPLPQGTPGKFPAQRRLPIVVSDSQCSGNPASSKATSKARNGGSGYQSEDLPPTNGFHVSHCWVPGRDIGGGAGGRPATSVRENRAPSDTPLDSTCDGNVAAESVNPSSGVAERRAIVRHSSEQGDSERWAAFGPPAAFWRPVPKPDSGTCGAEQVCTYECPRQETSKAVKSTCVLSLAGYRILYGHLRNFGSVLAGLCAGWWSAVEQLAHA